MSGSGYGGLVKIAKFRLCGRSQGGSKFSFLSSNSVNSGGVSVLI